MHLTFGMLCSEEMLIVYFAMEIKAVAGYLQWFMPFMAYSVQFLGFCQLPYDMLILQQSCMTNGLTWLYWPTVTYLPILFWFAKNDLGKVVKLIYWLENHTYW